ncbi:AraC family transcriptional regulator [Bacteroides sp. 51]|uniref:AraC family transcriptional regulator n=1 Tax=Bacteroides sp. 51 TaxID=2302938 RepID=UPI0013D56313|nr:AraC family transcriptional regulator [Bacteroides sp. 51]NDV80993.1 AraC family transcriptional regulator [Bacteroides sp. 51]
MKKPSKRRTGFQGEKRISLPAKVLKNLTEENIYINHIGYYPKAYNHYRRRKYGCEDNILIYCVQGKGYYMYDGVKYQVNTNQFIIIPFTTKALSYWADQDDPWTIYWLHFTGKGLPAFNDKYRIGVDKRPVYIPYNAEGIFVWNKMFDSLSRGPGLPNIRNASLCLYYFMATFIYPEHYNQADDAGDEENTINQTIDYMRQNLKKKVTVREMAALHNLSESYFSKLFRTATGMPPIDYFIYIRMQEACRLLCSTNYSIKQIAYLMGYDDPYYFSRIFKKLMNLSPENYRRSILNTMAQDMEEAQK